MITTTNPPSDIEAAVLDYYRPYYKSCGLSHADTLAHTRLTEEKQEIARLSKFQRTLSIKFKSTEKHCIVGAGTGGLATALYKTHGIQAFGVEPNPIELNIIHAKCLQHNIPTTNFRLEYGENMSFADNSFDVVHCYTVLEHVKSVSQCLSEMIRIVKPGGFIYINTPNYNFPREGHYKVIAPTFLGKLPTRIWLTLIGRPTAFLQEIHFLTPRQIDHVLNHHSHICWYRIYTPLPVQQNTSTNLFGQIEQHVFTFWQNTLGIYPQQDVIIRKLQ